MNKSTYIDYKLIEQVPNKYNIRPQDIHKFTVLDWEKLKKYTWFNTAMNSPCWCHLEGSNGGGFYGDDADEFWIGFYENGKVDYWFTSYEGMCGYEFDTFYDANHIHNKYDMAVQVNAMRYINKLLDEKIIAIS